MNAPDVGARLRFLQSPTAHLAYAGPQADLKMIETHMSWVFVSAEHVLKLKKPVRFPYLDFSTLAAREFFCREELRLNARLAPDVYLGLFALHWDGRALSLHCEHDLPHGGAILDWLVWMRRLPQARMLDALIANHAVGRDEIDSLADVMIGFYRSVPALAISGADYVAQFQRELAVDREILLHPRFGLLGASSALDRLDAAMLRATPVLHARAEQGRVFDGHGDLRPEHVCLLPTPVVIDALEFNAALRRVDPLDEIAYLGMECAMAGAAWIGPQLSQRCMTALEPDSQPAPALSPLYTAYRSMLRARLSASHLLDPAPQRPHHWSPLAQRYLDTALHALDSLDDGVNPHAVSAHGKP